LSDERLSHKDRKFLSRQRNAFSGSIAELIKVLEDHQYAHVREHRLRTLFEALGATCIIARNQLLDPIKDRLSTAKAAGKKKEMTAKGDDIIIAAARPIWHKHTTWKPWRVAGTIYEQVKDQLPRRLLQNAIAKRLGRLRNRIFSTG